MSQDWCEQYEPKKNTEVTDRTMQFDEQEDRLRARVADISHQILVLSGKGGVGKSTVSVNLAWALALRDYQTGLLDADLNGPSIPLMMGLSNDALTSIGGFAPISVMSQLHVMSVGLMLESTSTPTIWRGPLRGNVIRQFIADVEWPSLDYLVVDLPPGTGDEPLTLAQAFPNADGGIIVTTPQEASLADCRKAINFLHAVKMPVIGVIENMSGFVCPHCGEVTDIFSKDGGKAMAEEMGVPFLGSLPLAPEVVSMSDNGSPMLGSQSTPALKQAFENIVECILQTTNK